MNTSLEVPFLWVYKGKEGQPRKPHLETRGSDFKTKAPSSPGSRPRKLPWRSNSVSCGQLAASCPKRKRSIDPLVAWFLLLAFLFVFHSGLPFCWFLSLACCFLPLLPFLSCCCFVPSFLVFFSRRVAVIRCEFWSGPAKGG